jgi:phage shock protein C
MRAPDPGRHAEAMDTTAIDQDTQPATQREPQRAVLRRPSGGRMLTGVAAGLADYLGVDATLVRIAFVVLTFFGGTGMALYLAGLLLIPEEGSDQSIAASLIQSLQSRSH